MVMESLRRKPVKWSDITQSYQFPSSAGKVVPQPEKTDTSKMDLYFKRLDYKLALMKAQEKPPEILDRIYDYAHSLATDINSFEENQSQLPYFTEIYGNVDKFGDVTPIPDWQFDLDIAEEVKRIPQVEQPKPRGDILETQTDPLTGKQIPLSQTEAEREMWQRGKAQGYGALFGTQSDIRQREDLVARKQAELDRIATQGRTEQISSAIANNTPVNEAQQRAELFRQFEDIKQQKLSSLDPEMDWVQRWFVEHEQNPYTPITPTGEDRLNALGVELQKWNDIANNYPDTPVNVGESVTWGDVANQSKERIQGMLDAIRDAPPVTVGNSVSGFTNISQGDAETLGSDAVTAIRPLAPTTPDWLSRLVPGLKTGQPIRSNVELPTPSLQQWNTLAPSIQTKYAGFSNWAGTPIKDTLARMNLMRPETPRGAGRFSWNVARQ